MALGLIIKRICGPAIMGKRWWGQVLRVLLLYVVLRWSSSLLLLASVGGNGGVNCGGGGSDRRGHVHSLVVDSVRAAADDCGNCAEMYPSAMQASLLKYIVWTLVVTYTICLVYLPEAVSVRRSMAAPSIGRSAPFAALIFIRAGMSVLLVIPIRWMVSKLAKQLWQPVSAMAFTTVGMVPIGFFPPSLA